MGRRNEPASAGPPVSLNRTRNATGSQFRVGQLSEGKGNEGENYTEGMAPTRVASGRRKT